MKYLLINVLLYFLKCYMNKFLNKFLNIFYISQNYEIKPYQSENPDITQDFYNNKAKYTLIYL